MSKDQEPCGDSSKPYNWEGLIELDRAIADNRLTRHRWQKAWADPLNRVVTLAVLLLLALFAGYALVEDLIINP